MRDLQGHLAEAESYFREAEVEFTQEHYHLVVGNLMYGLHILEELKQDAHPLIGKIFLLLTRTHFRLKHYEKAHEMWEKAFNFYEEQDGLTLVDLYYLQGLLYSEEKKDKKAIKSYEKALNLLQEVTEGAGQAFKHSCLYNLANCYLRLQDYPKAKEKYQILSRILRRGVNNSLKGKVLVGLGYIYHLEDKLGLAERCYHIARKYLDPEADSIAYGRASHNLGEILLAKGKKAKARAFFLQSLEPDNVTKVDKGRATSSLCGIGFTYLGEDLEKVKSYCVDALNLAMGGTVTRFSMTDEQELGRVFFLLCHLLYTEGNYSDLNIYLTQAENIFKKYNMLQELSHLEDFKNKYMTKEVKNE